MRPAALQLLHQGSPEELLPFGDQVPRRQRDGEVPARTAACVSLPGGVDASEGIATSGDQATLGCCRAEAPDRADVDADHAPIIAATG